MVTKLAPLRLASLMMGAWFLFVSMANKVAGFVGSFIGEGTEQAENALSIFAGIGITAGISAVILYFLADRLVDWMHGAEGPAQHEEPYGQVLKEELEVEAHSLELERHLPYPGDKASPASS